MVILEGLDLADVEPGAYRLVALPLSIPDAEGAPARAVLLDERYSGESGGPGRFVPVVG